MKDVASTMTPFPRIRHVGHPRAGALPELGLAGLALTQCKRAATERPFTTPLLCNLGESASTNMRVGKQALANLHAGED